MTPTLSPSEREKRLSEIERIHNATVKMISEAINSSEGSLAIDPELEHSLNRERELLSLTRQPLPFANWFSIATLPEKENYILLLDDSDHDYRCGSIFYEKPNELKGWTHWAYFPALSVPALSSNNS